MTQGHRHRIILDYLHQHGELVVDVACQLLTASPATIRRDFSELAEAGLVEKTWGGIIKKNEFAESTGMLPITYRQQHRVAEKIAIAEKAASYVEDGQVIIVDGGTTTYQMAPYIAHKNIRIITNSIIVAYSIDQHKKHKKGAEIMVTGGNLYPESGLLVGPQTNSNLKSYHADAAFLSCGALDETCPTNSNQWVVESEQIMIAQSKKVFLLADSSKWGQRNMCSVCDWNSIHILISDVEAARHPLYQMLKNQLQIIIV